MTIPDLQAALARSEAETESIRKKLHEAMIAASPFRVGDRVRDKADSTYMVMRVFVAYGSVRCDLWNGGKESRQGHELQRIDESGNVLPPRGEGSNA